MSDALTDTRSGPMFPHQTDVCEFCGKSGRQIARYGHSTACPKALPETLPPGKSFHFEPGDGSLSLCEELEPAPTMAQLAANDNLAGPDWPTDGASKIDGLDDGKIAEAVAEATGQTPPGPKPILPTDSAERKNTPICTGVFDYFPRALAYISRVSKQGQIQHNLPKLGWDKTKSTDHPDCIARHLIERGTRDPLDGLRHSGKLGWRALANLEIELEEAEKNGEAW
jgi:hypothetical protein